VHSCHSFGEQNVYFPCIELHIKSLNLRGQTRFIGLYCATLKRLWSELLITEDFCFRSPRFYNDSTENCEINSKFCEARKEWDGGGTSHCALGIDMYVLFIYRKSAFAILGLKITDLKKC